MSHPAFSRADRWHGLHGARRGPPAPHHDGPVTSWLRSTGHGVVEALDGRRTHSARPSRSWGRSEQSRRHEAVSAPSESSGRSSRPWLGLVTALVTLLAVVALAELLSR